MAHKKSFWGFFLKIFFGLALLLIGTSAGFVVGRFLAHVSLLSRESLVFFASFIFYLLIHLLFYKPILSHVMAHELTHALAAVLMGGRVTSIHASTTGGTTVVNKSHVFISLAPYVFPLYTALCLLLYVIAAPPFRIYLTGLIGFTYSFHLALTVYSLSHHQPDLKEGGVVFSLIFIFSGNMIVLLILVTILWPQTLSLPQAFSEMFRWAWYFVQTLFHLLKSHLSSPEGHPK